MNRIFKSCVVIIFLMTTISSVFSQSQSINVLDIWNGEENENLVGQIIAPFCVISDFAIDQDENQNTGYFSDKDCDTCSDQPIAADNFIAPKDGMIDQICFLGAYFPNNISQISEVFTIVFYDDNAGLPGNIIYGPTTLNITEKNTTGGTLLAFDEYGYQGDFSPFAVTMGTTYWVSIQANTTGNPDSWLWESGNQDATNGVSGSAFNFDNTQMNWFANVGDMAFALGYEEATVVPTLGQWALIVLGFLVLIFGVVVIKNTAIVTRILRD